MLQRTQSSLIYLDRPSASKQREDILIMLHGYGSNEKDLMQLAPSLDQNLHLITPRAPLALAPEMYGWFPIEFTQEGITVDREAAGRAKETLLEYLHGIVDRYNARENKVWLMGFSQGAVMSYLAALAEPALLHGVIALSGQFPESPFLVNAEPDLFRTLPFLVVHGIYDDVLPVTNGRHSERWLQEHADRLTYREYAMGHEINTEALELIRDWLYRTKSAKASP